MSPSPPVPKMSVNTQYPVRLTEVDSDVELNYTVYYTYSKDHEKDQWSSLNIIFKTNDGTWRMEAGLDVFAYCMGDENNGKTLLTVTNSDFDVLKVIPDWEGLYPSEETLLECLKGIKTKYGVDLLDRAAHKFYGVDGASFTGFLY